LECSNAITGQAASRTISPIRSSAWSEDSPSPTIATSGRSLAVADPTSPDVDLAGDHLVPESDHDLREQLEPLSLLVGEQNAQVLRSAVGHERAYVEWVAFNAASVGFGIRRVALRNPALS
jgi:hypothetical protein